MSWFKRVILGYGILAQLEVNIAKDADQCVFTEAVRGELVVKRLYYTTSQILDRS